MYPGAHARARAVQPAVIMAGSGEIITYADLESRTNRLAHFLRANGLHHRDHYSIFMENNARYVETCGAGERTGLYYTCVNSFLTPDELAYILANSESKILITSQAKRDVALEAMQQCPNIALCLVVDGPGEGAAVLNLDEATAGYPDSPVADESSGTPCCIPPAQRAARRASCGRYRSNRPERHCRFTTLWLRFGGSAKG